MVWHSITRQYWPAAEIAATSQVLDDARLRMPIAHIAMESPVLRDDRSEGGPEYRPAELTVRLSVPGEVSDAAPVLLGTVNDHGVPVRLRHSSRSSAATAGIAADAAQPAGITAASAASVDTAQPTGVSVNSGCSAPCGMSMLASPVRSSRRITPAT